MDEIDDRQDSAPISLGEELRKQREIRGIGLKEIADATKISTRFLEAIEKGNLKTLPAPVFTRGFIREYARYLGLDPEDLVDRYSEIAEAAVEKEEAEAPSPHRGTGAHGKVISQSAPSNRGLWTTIAVVVAVVILGLGLWYISGRGEGKGPRPKTPVTESRSSTHEVARQPVTPSTAVAPATRQKTLTLVVKAVEDSWITLDADGERRISDVLKKGEERKFEASRDFRFETIGNAGGLELTLNGVRLPSLGESGQVLKDKVFDRQTLQRLEQKNGSDERSPL
ncbi:MAG: helix-turn-helix domain-containing protein [Thermoanaerobaculia bacterium]